MTIQDAITSYIETKTELALVLHKLSDKNFVDCIAKVWEKTKDSRFVIPDLKQELFIEFTKDKADYDRLTHVLYAALEEIEEAKTNEARNLAFIHFMQTIHFTVSDIFDPTYTSKDNTDAEKVKYASDEGVLKAFSREYAYRYTKEYPGEKFDVEKLFDMAIKIFDEGGMHKNARIYYLDYASPERLPGLQAFRKELHDAHEKALELTKAQIDDWSGSSTL